MVRVASELLDFSFPSGHVVGFVSLYGFLFFLIYVLFRRSPWRTAALVLCGLLLGLVGISRIYLGHHWASDVLGGYAFGSAYLLLLVEFYRLTTPRPGSTTRDVAHGLPLEAARRRGADERHASPADRLEGRSA